MPDHHEHPEKHSDGSRSDELDRKSPTAYAADQAAADADQTAADATQTLSDAYQTLADEDQVLAERDQAHADADQRVSDRDQAVSDQDRSIQASPDPKHLDALAASDAERARTTVERAETTGARTLTMFDRAEGAAQRDEQAAQRDVRAAARDRTADLRDQASDDHERALGRKDGYPARARATAAEDRAHSTEDRLGAAEDRKQATLDRKQGAIDFERAQLDDLTGFLRLGVGTAVLQREIDRARRSGESLVFAYCDVDGLKQVNDERGHAAGDVLLKRVAEALRSRLRSYDPVVRVGGDEFVCALTEISLEEAAGILHEVQGLLEVGRDGSSFSFGLTALRPDDDLAMLLERGDHDLRKAKSERNGHGKPQWRGDESSRWGLVKLASSPAQLSESLTSLWTEYAGTKPTATRTEVRGDVVTCVLVDAVQDFNQSMDTAQIADAGHGVGKLTAAGYKRDAVAAVVRLTHQRVASFMSSHDRETDVATEVFTLERSSSGRGTRPRRDPETSPALPPPRA